MTDDDYEALMERLETLEASLALLTAIATRTETRLVKLIIHLGAQHIIQSR
jgi:hypothetical protein